MLKFFNLLAVSSLAVFLSTLAAVPGATASPAPSPFHHGVAAAKRSHGHIARSIHARSPVDKPILKKRGVKCRPRDALPAPIPEPSPSPSPEPAPAPSPSPSPEPSPSPSPSPSPQPETPPATGSGKGKAGLAWAMGNDPAIRTTASSNTAFVYTWSEWAPNLAAELGIEFIPMLWGVGQDKIDGFRSRIQVGFQGKILGFNEPNHDGQANVSPQQAAEVWVNVIEPYCRAGAQCISPATTSAPSGIDWMQQFIDACNGRCSIDAIALHWYGTQSNDFISYVEQWVNRFHKPVYVTEYACHSFTGGAQPNQAQADEFHRNVATYMNGNPSVVGYFPFGWMNDMVGVSETNRLLSGGQPTALGNRYVHNSW